MKNTKGYIYFAIKTENNLFDLEWFNERLTIKPTKFNKIHDRGDLPKCTTWRYSTPELDNPIYYIEIEKLVDELIPYQDSFRDLGIKNPEFKMVLEVVMFLADETPALCFSKKALDFVTYVGAEIDCDIYNSLSNA